MIGYLNNPIWVISRTPRRLRRGEKKLSMWDETGMPRHHEVLFYVQSEENARKVREHFEKHAGYWYHYMMQAVYLYP